MSLLSGQGFFSWCKYQGQLIGLALMFFTQIPVSKNLPYSATRMNKANRYFSLIGLFVGAAVSLVFYIANQLWSTEVAIIITMVFSVLLTGAFHEDGLADMADGMGGGYTKEKRLTIMKDSRLGTYGAISLVLSVLLKFYLWVELAQFNVLIFSIIFAYSLSRAFAASLIFDMAYVTDSDESKSKPLASKQSLSEVITLFVVAFIPVIFIERYIAESFSLIVTMLTSLVVFRFVFRRWLIARIGGFTGDCLGAVQQICELIIYLIILNHISIVGGA
jgi:adenosylcobinamide-GDP ribazoletransferase